MELPFSLSICDPQKWQFTRLNLLLPSFWPADPVSLLDRLSLSVCQSVSETFHCLCLCLSSLPPSLFLHFPSISSPSLSPIFRACTKGEGRGQAGVSRAGRARRPPSHHRGPQSPWGAQKKPLGLGGFGTLIVPLWPGLCRWSLGGR